MGAQTPLVIVIWVLMMMPCRSLVVKGLQTVLIKYNYDNLDNNVEVWGGAGGMGSMTGINFSLISPRCASQTKSVIHA